MKKALTWKTRGGDLEIRDLDELFEVLVRIKQEDIDEEISANINSNEDKLVDWVETNFPKKLGLITGLRNMGEFTPQQVREKLVRDLRGFIS